MHHVEQKMKKVCKTDILYVVILFLSVLIVLVLFNKWMDISSTQVMINIFWMKDKSKEGKFPVTRKMAIKQYLDK